MHQILRGIQLSKPLKQRLFCQTDTPMARAVQLRGQLMELGYRVLLMTAEHLQIASPDVPNRFVGYHIDQAERLLEAIHV